ncbi:hypothetical protein H1R17_09620 [Flavobacterium sp. xlx-214]|uniref:hypothetical protein n=1 Tax=unclassified Flavobacterium TaxID=196869 RepID=UPI0013D7BA5A|nr:MULTISPECIES: hypothetical protein [unclassified Flavobacterium]MBA5793504.1 hypothetical protein [Flavobacterium sp. xlx-221]QMI82726.1 hypothetical protein H1R17_09620 [Flavobacterium sp. xlx-214]
MNGNMTAVWQDTFATTKAVDQDFTLPQTVENGERFVFKVASQSNIDWKTLSLTPRLYYIYLSGDDRGNQSRRFADVGVFTSDTLG